jgi:nitroreductase
VLHPLLSARWSPTAFDTGHRVTAEEVELLLEAARWAPSAGNSQPWAFVSGRRGDDTHGVLVRHLMPSAARWAPGASLLVANLAHRWVEDTDWEYSEFSLYDLGQAVAHMTLQGQALGLHARQFRAFDREGLQAELEVPPHWQVATLTAFGRPVPEAATRSGARDRRPVDDLRWPPAEA